MLLVLILGTAGLIIYKKNHHFSSIAAGTVIDSLNGVKVYYNGSVGNISGRNFAADGYNLGLKYQCVEFVKRYYYEHLNHKMPDSYGDAKDFFNHSLKDGELNKKRNLIQHSNPGRYKPKVDDMLIYSGSTFNKFGHVAIVSKVSAGEIEIIQQNAGPVSGARQNFKLKNRGRTWEIGNERIMGWLRK